MPQANPVEPAAGSSGFAGSGVWGSGQLSDSAASRVLFSDRLLASLRRGLVLLRPGLRPLPNSRLRTVHFSSGSQFTLRREGNETHLSSPIPLGCCWPTTPPCRLGGGGGRLGPALLPLSSPRGHRASRSTAAGGDGGGDGGKGLRERKAGTWKARCSRSWPVLPSRGRGQRHLLAT